MVGLWVKPSVGRGAQGGPHFTPHAASESAAAAGMSKSRRRDHERLKPALLTPSHLAGMSRRDAMSSISALAVLC